MRTACCMLLILALVILTVNGDSIFDWDAEKGRRTENWMTEEQKAVMARLRKKPTEMRDKVLEFFNQLPAEIRAEWDEYHMKECFEWVKTVASDDEMSELKKLESNKDIDKLVAKVYTYLPRLPDRRLARVELWKDECIRLLKKESRRLRDSEQN